MKFLFEKQMVLRAKRLMRVRKFKCLRSIRWVFDCQLYGSQDIERSGSKAGNKGVEAALAAIEMVNLLRQIG